MISKEKVKEILTTLEQDLNYMQEESCLYVINSFYDMRIKENAIEYIRNLLSNLIDDTSNLINDALNEISEEN